jgi:hypothetical protein
MDVASRVAEGLKTKTAVAEVIIQVRRVMLRFKNAANRFQSAQ